MKMERIASSETSALKAQKPGDYPKDTIRHSTHLENLKSRLNADLFNAKTAISSPYVVKCKINANHVVTMILQSMEIQHTKLQIHALNIDFFLSTGV